MDTTDTQGFVYIADGDSYIEEAICSAKTVKRYMPNVPITLYANKTVNKDVFDNCNVLDDFSGKEGYKIRPHMFPYDKNIYMDVDTILCDDVSELFEVLNTYDLAVCHSPGRYAVAGAPECIREYNCGFICYNKTDDVKRLMHRWQEWHEEFRGKSFQGSRAGGNQHPFARSVYESDVNHVVLPREYNVRIPRPGYVNMDVKIIHGRTDLGLEHIKRKLNEREGPRIYYMGGNIVTDPFRVRSNSKVYSALRFYRKGGFKKLSREVIDYVNKELNLLK